MVPFYWSYTVFILCGSLTFIILRNRAPIVEKSIQIIFDDEKYSKQYCEIYNVTV